MATATAGAFALDMDSLDLSILVGSGTRTSDPTSYAVTAGGETITLTGSGFSYGANGAPTSGQVTGVRGEYQGGMTFEVTGVSVAANALIGLANNRDAEGAKQAVFAGNDQLTGSPLADVLRAYGGVDSISGGTGGDTLDGGTGADTLSGGAGNDLLVDLDGGNYLRGDEGDDWIVGGSEFDDINGNMGNDTCVSGGGDDWVVGGKDNDSLVGSAGSNLVYGNLGNDTCDGGAGNDIIRGGQDNDVVGGGAGDDYVSGDRGDDTMTGGAGADIFHSFGEAGIDRVTDFNLAEGDRVVLDTGTTYTVMQSGADTVISMTGGGQVILAGVSMSSLTGNWITVG